MSVLAESQAGKRVQAQGHPLKSFTVPAPPPISAPGTPQPKHVGKLIDNDRTTTATAPLQTIIVQIKLKKFCFGILCAL